MQPLGDESNLWESLLRENSTRTKKSLSSRIICLGDRKVGKSSIVAKFTAGSIAADVRNGTQWPYREIITYDYFDASEIQNDGKGQYLHIVYVL